MKRIKAKNIVFYVVNSSPCIKTFRSQKAMHKFITEFKTQYAGQVEDGWWIDYAITNIQGDVLQIDGVEKL